MQSLQKKVRRSDGLKFLSTVMPQSASRTFQHRKVCGISIGSLFNIKSEQSSSVYCLFQAKKAAPVSDSSDSLLEPSVTPHRNQEQVCAIAIDAPCNLTTWPKLMTVTFRSTHNSLCPDPSDLLGPFHMKRFVLFSVVLKLWFQLSTSDHCITCFRSMKNRTPGVMAVIPQQSSWVMQSLSWRKRMTLLTLWRVRWRNWKREKSRGRSLSKVCIPSSSDFCCVFLERSFKHLCKSFPALRAELEEAKKVDLTTIKGMSYLLLLPVCTWNG